METENNPKVPIYKITYEVAQDGSFAFIVNGDVAPKKDPRDESEFLGAKPLEIFFDNKFEWKLKQRINLAKRKKEDFRNLI
jgi:hypothetical protein